MTAQETNLLNAYESTLTGTIGASDLTLTVNAVVDSASNTLTAPCYLVVNPDSATNREVILVNSINVGTKTLTISAIGDRYLTGSAATSGLSHASGSVIRMSPLQQHIEDVNDRVDTIINEAGTAVNTSLFLDEDDMSSDSPTKGVTQQSVKAYVDSQVTAQDLDFAGDTGTGQVDLDSQTFTIAGTTNEIETSALNQTITIGLPSSISVNVTGDLTGNVTATSVLADGVTATTQTAGDNSTKVATTAYVDAISVDDNLTVSDGTTSTTVDLDTQTFSILGTANEITTTTSAQTITISLPATINADTTGNAATATALETARTIGGVSFDGTANINLPGVNTAGNQDTSGNAATATTLETARTIAGNSFDGSANITIDAGDLSDVNTTGVTNGQVLAYNSTSGDFEPTDPTTGDITAVNTNANSGLAGGAASGDVSLTVDPSNLTDGTAITVDTSNDFLILEDVTDGSVYKVNPEQIASGSANALIDGTSDLTITDGTGLDYDISGTDTASWTSGGIALTTNGGMFRHHQTQASTFTIATNEGTLLAGPITITGTVTNNGTMVVI